MAGAGCRIGRSHTNHSKDEVPGSVAVGSEDAIPVALNVESPMKDLNAPILAEDLLLVLFQPGSGTVLGEDTLPVVLAGAALADLALDGSVRIATDGAGSVHVEAVEGRAPSDGILRLAWEHASNSPGGVQVLLAAIGPALRQPLLERLIARGDIREENGKVLGLLRVASLKDGGSGRRSGLIGDVRAVLFDGMAPTPRVAALAALMWASGTLHRFDPDIPWNAVVIARARELERGRWGAEGATRAVARAAAAMIGSIAVAVRSRNTPPGLNPEAGP